MTKYCIVCASPFRTFPAWERKAGAKFCSRSCMGKAKIKAPKSPDAGRQTARRIHRLLGKCDYCENPARDRHHKNGDATDNSTENLAFLCRKCHMEEDGRLMKFVASAGGRIDHPLPPRPCSECGRLWKPTRRGLCGACYDRKRPWRTAECGGEIGEMD